jgi:phage shock protein C
MTDTPSPPPPMTEQPLAPPVRAPLQRSASDTMLGGVCGGLAEHTGIDATLWRLGFVVFALFGAGVLVYALLWVLMPPAPGRRPNALDGLAERLHDALTGSRTAGTGS